MSSKKTQRCSFKQHDKHDKIIKPSPKLPLTFKKVKRNKRDDKHPWQ